MHTVLLKSKRNGFVDNYFYGSIFHANQNSFIFSVGEDKTTIAFMRSLAKPMQASILYDCNIIKDLKITNEELAIFSGSHSGTKRHLKVLHNLFKKHDLSVKDLDIVPIEPLDKKDYKGRKTKFHNNCSGKHSMMLLYCKYKGYDLDYVNPKNPIQKEIKAKQEYLSEYKSSILTFDGCSTALWGLPYENIIKGYFNLIKTHPDLINAIMKNPYIYGGNNRFDTEIIRLGRGNLFSKVGAGGFVIVYNFDKKEILLVKLAQDNNPIRRIITLNYLNKLKWINCEVDLNIYNQKKQIVAKYEF